MLCNIRFYVKITQIFVTSLKKLLVLIKKQGSYDDNL